MESEVRVIMITYNGNKFFKQQFDSILKQKELESIHLYDDNSGKEFTDMLSMVSQQSSKTTLHLNQTNLGVIKNIKQALSKNHNASYIALSDQDDIWSPLKLKATLSEMKLLEKDRPDIPALIYHDMQMIDQDASILSGTYWGLKRTNLFEHKFRSNLVSNLITGSASLMNKALVRFAKDIPEHLSIYHDAWLGMVAYSMGRVKCVKEPFSMYRTHTDSLTFNSKPSQNIFKRVIRNLKYISGTEVHLKNQFEFVEYFLSVYRNNLSNEYIVEFENFVSLKDASFFRQKIAIRNLIAQKKRRDD